MNIKHFTHPSVDGYLGLFCFLAIVNNKHGCAGMFVACEPRPLQVCTQEWCNWVIWWFYFQYSEDFPYCFPH